MDDQTAGGAGSPEPPPEPPRADPIVGELVTETLDYDGGRQVTVYVPPDSPKAVVFAGDGQGISQWGGFLEAADVSSTAGRRAHSRKSTSCCWWTTRPVRARCALRNAKADPSCARRAPSASLVPPCSVEFRCFAEYSE